MQDKPTGDAKRPSGADDRTTNRTTDDAARVGGSPSREDEVVIPIVAEEVSVETARVARGAVRVRKHVETNEQTVSTPLVHEEVVVERVPIDRRVDDAPPEPHEENGVLVIPVLEEIAVVEKRLVLREEIRVSRRRTTTTDSRVVALRHEVADVERVDLEHTADQEKKGGNS
jgi:uncharacterized protein (TIGR02271 family)